MSNVKLFLISVKYLKFTNIKNYNKPIRSLSSLGTFLKTFLKFSERDLYVGDKILEYHDLFLF